MTAYTEPPAQDAHAHTHTPGTPESVASMEEPLPTRTSGCVRKTFPGCGPGHSAGREVGLSAGFTDGLCPPCKRGKTKALFRWEPPRPWEARLAGGKVWRDAPGKGAGGAWALHVVGLEAPAAAPAPRRATKMSAEVASGLPCHAWRSRPSEYPMAASSHCARGGPLPGSQAYYLSHLNSLE